MTPDIKNEVLEMEKLTLELFPILTRLNHEYGTRYLIGFLACFISEMAEQQPDPEGAIQEFMEMIKIVTMEEDEDDDKKRSEARPQKSEKIP